MKISVILPFYNKLAGFKFAAARSRLYAHKDVELVIPMDSQDQESELLRFVRGRFKARVIVNDQPHDWRPPCKSINVGLRHSCGEYVIIQSPETILYADAGTIIRHSNFEKCFVTGLLYHGKRDDYPTSYSWFSRRGFTPGYGFIMVRRDVIEAINGMDERRNSYGGDDDDIRHRLKQLNFKCVVDSKIKLIHIAHGSEKRPPRIEFEPYGYDIVIPEQDDWGNDFSRISYDYAN